jgi:hypothetical protein
MSSPTPTPSPTPKEVNFKTLATDFETLANLHKQLNSFGLGDIDQLTYWTQSRLKEDNTEYQSPYYPLLYIVPSKVENDLQYKVWEFNTTVSDIVEGSLQNNEDTLSDTLQILQDVISQFRLSTTNVLGNYYDKYYVDDEVVCTPFLGEQDDDLNGWNGLLRIKTMTSLDRCAAAFNEWTGASITHPNGINLKTFTDDFRILSDYHKQIQSYGFGKMDEFTYWNEMRLKEDNTQFNSPYYPYFYVIPNDVIQKFGFMEYKFTFIVSDIIQRSLENQVDVLSDTLQIMDDILGQFRLSVTNSLGNFNELYYLNTPIVCTPFLEKYDDLLGGWVADITIEVKTPLDRCDAPFDTFVSPTPSPSPTQTPGLVTPTQTPTNTQTPSVTPTNTQTPSVTPTTTPTPSVTRTQTPTPTTTRTPTPTGTPTQTPTPTSTPPPPFDPLSLGNLQHWYLSTSGATAASWTNLGLLGGAVNQGDPLLRPTIITETLGTFSGTAVNYFGAQNQGSGFPLENYSGSSIFMVMKINAYDPLRNWTINLAGGAGVCAIITTNQPGIVKNPNVILPTINPYPLGELFMASSGQSNSFISLSFNDVLGSSVAPFTGTDVSDFFNIGSNEAQTANDTSIFELLIYNRLLNASEYAQVVNYIKTKYQYNSW